MGHNNESNSHKEMNDLIFTNVRDTDLNTRQHEESLQLKERMPFLPSQSFVHILGIILLQHDKLGHFQLDVIYAVKWYLILQEDRYPFHQTKYAHTHIPCEDL